MKTVLKSILTLAIGLGALELGAENVFITSFYNNSNYTPAPHSQSSGFSLAGASDSSMSTAEPSPGVSPRRVLYGLSEGAWWSVTPTNGTWGSMNFTSLQNTGVYKIYVTKGQSGNASTNIIVTMTATGGTLADTNGVGSAGVPLDVYQRAKPNHVWVHVGYITNDSPNPTITFTHTAGAIDNNADITLIPGQRWYVDAIWFEFMDQCSGTVPPVSIAGPLVQGQEFVNVLNVANGATNVVVYANGSEIGQTNSVTGFAGGSMEISTTALSKGAIITAQQKRNGCESVLGSTGPEVGGGPNPQLRAFLGMLKDSSLTGPIGANTTTDSSINYFLKAYGLTSGFGTAFLGGETLLPSSCWQTVTFSHSDPNFTSGGTQVGIEDPYAALSGLAFSINETDSGPYDLYIDQIMNGDVVIDDFEGYAVGTTNTFNAPNAASLPSPGSTYVQGHNSSVISDANAFDGSKSCRIQWQWADSTTIRWAHVLANASTTSGKHYPQIDTTKPITVRYLLLPVGETTDKMSFASVPANQTKAPGASVTFAVEAVGDAPYTYQWRFENNDISGETGSSFTKSDLQEFDAGVYSVVVNSSTGCTATHDATLTVSTVTEPPTLNISVNGSQLTLTWDGPFTLQEASALTGSPGDWSDVSASTGHQVSTASGVKFFRLRE